MKSIYFADHLKIKLFSQSIQIEVSVQGVSEELLKGNDSLDDDYKVLMVAFHVMLIGAVYVMLMGAFHVILIQI